MVEEGCCVEGGDDRGVSACSRAGVRVEGEPETAVGAWQVKVAVLLSDEEEMGEVNVERHSCLRILLHGSSDRPLTSASNTTQTEIAPAPAYARCFPRSPYAHKIT